MPTGEFSRSWVLWLFFFTCLSVKVSATAPLTVSELIQHISENEQALRACEADFSVYSEPTGEPFWEGTWGYEDRKGFLRGSQHAVLPDGAKIMYQEIFAFDGERLYTYQPEPHRKSGNVRELDTDLDSRLSPQMLLGYSIRQRGRYRLSEALGQGEDARILSVDESIDGYPCILLQCNVPVDIKQTTEKTVPGALRVWVDPERNYRPRRIEQFRDPEARELLVVYDDIRLEQVDGLWLPTSGRRIVYMKEAVPLNGHTLEEVRLMTGEEMRENLQFVVKPSEGGTNRIKVSLWRVLDDIDDSKFKVEFPPGSKVWDDFAQVSLERDTAVPHDLTEVSPKLSTITEGERTVNEAAGVNKEPRSETATNFRIFPRVATALAGIMVGGLLLSALVVLGISRSRRSKSN